MKSATEPGFYLRQFELGPMRNLSYLIGDTATRKGAVIDPGWDADVLLDRLEADGFKLDQVWLTHGHYDHAQEVGAVLARASVPVYLSEKEMPALTPDVPELRRTKDGEQLVLGKLSALCIHTPGHTPGGQCFLLDKTLFTGDTLFINGCGRCDLGGSNVEDMYDSLYRKLWALPDDVMVYPGHHYGAVSSDTLGRQKQTNRFLKAENKESFIRIRMGF